ncbi:N-acetylmuramate alpha-1-phosphate uridylyltransferase MurU [Dokdonella sp.]|uniref:N-acetylmuramate alpha-1-phosphate uridylyltransferase MurU n=1 Tax=Dokdonella sp. TaxID=2291710 RepID=UPI003C482313
MSFRRAMIFAAGRGERMRPLTDATPKPLLRVGGKMLIEWHLESLARIGVSDVVINTSHLASQFPQALGDGSRWGLQIHFAEEGPIPLETGGGMLNALPILGEGPFVVVNGDVWSNYDFARLPTKLAGQAHLLLVDNPEQHPRGDFHLASSGLVEATGSPLLTYSGIGLYRASLFAHWQDDLDKAGHAPIDNSPPRFALAHLLRAAMGRGEVSGEHHSGHWTDVGTPGRLAELDDRLSGRTAAPDPNS